MPTNPRQRLTRDHLGNIFVGVVAAAALTTAGIAAVRFRAEQRAQQGAIVASEPRPVSNWAELVAVARRVDTSSGPVRMVVFGDYQCPACARADVIMDSLARDRGRALGVAHIHFPLTAIHPEALSAALAAECAGEQGRFAEFHQYAYRHQAEIGRVPWSELAVRSHASDTSRFGACMRDAKTTARVTAQAALATRMGVNGTPTLVVDGMMYPAGAPAAVLAKAAEGRD